MYRKKDTLLDYKSAIRQKFEVEKRGDFASFLLNPSRALLRQLCVQRFKNNPSKEDLKTFALFFGFEFEPTALQKLKAQTDKLRPIETFLKGETDLSLVEGINLAAILVDFQPRPYLKFGKINTDFEENSTVVICDEIDESKKSAEKKKDIFLNFKNKIGKGVVLVFGLFSVGYTVKEIGFPTKKCMQWQENQYKEIACDTKGIVNFSAIIPIEEHQFELKKIHVDSATIFFKGTKPLVFYCKVNGKLEFFNQLGTHPETGQVLKPISTYIINKYVKNK